MAISIGNVTNSGNQTGTSLISGSHTCATNTKMLVAIITGVDASNTDKLLQYVSYGTHRMISLQTSTLTNTGTIHIAFLRNPPTGSSETYAVQTIGSNTDIQITLVDLVSTNPIAYKESNSSTGNFTSFSKTYTSVPTGSISVGGCVLFNSSAAALSVSIGSEVAGSEVDMGSQVASAGYDLESSGSCGTKWSFTAAGDYKAMTALFVENVSPTVALGTPANNASVSDTTPALTFTGTDVNGETLEYQIDIDTSTSFNSGMTAFHKNLLTPVGTMPWAGNNAKIRIGIVFYLPFDCKIKRVQIPMKKTAATTCNGTLSCVISPDVTFMETSTLYSLFSNGGNPVATATTIDVATLFTTTDKINVNFDFTPTELTGGKYYSAVIDVNNTTGSLTTLEYYYPNTSAYQDAMFEGTSYKSGAATYINNHDIEHTFYLESGAISAFSTNETGFSAGVSHPTASGAEQTYTVQTELTGTTYYWRVRTTDRTGTKYFYQWGGWSPGDSTNGYDTFTLSNDNKTGTFTITNSAGISMTGYKSNILAALNAFAAATAMAAAGKKATDRALGTIGTAAAAMASAGKKGASQALGVIGSASSGIAAAGSRGAANTVSFAATNMVSIAGNKQANKAISIENATGITTAGKKDTSGTVSISNAAGIASAGTKGAKSVDAIATPVYVMEDTETLGVKTLYPPSIEPSWVAHVNDLWLMGFMTENEDISIPTGFTRIGTDVTLGEPLQPNSLRLISCYKIITQSDLTNGVAVDHSLNEQVQLVHQSIRGIDHHNPIQGYTTYIKSAVDNTFNAPGIVTKKNNSAVVNQVAFTWDANNGGSDSANNADFTDITPPIYYQATSYATGGCVAAVEGIKATAGTVGETTWEYFAGYGVTSSMVFKTIAFNPLEPILFEAATAISIFGAVAAQNINGTFAISNAAMFAIAGRKDAVKDISITNASGIAAAGTKGASRAIGTIAAATGYVTVGKKAASNTLALNAAAAFASAGKKGASSTFIASAVTNATIAGKRGQSGSMTISTAATFASTGKKGGLSPFVASAAAAFAAAGIKKASIALSAFTASTSLTVTGSQLSVIVGSFSMSNATSFAAAGKKAATRDIGAINASANVTFAGAKATTRAIGAISAAAAFAAAGTKGALRVLGAITAATGITTAGKKGASNNFTTSGVTGITIASGIKAAQGTVNISAAGALLSQGYKQAFAAITISASTSVTVTGAQATQGMVKVWSGAAWELKPLKVWNGSEWVLKPLKAWDGSQWKS